MRLLGRNRLRELYGLDGQTDAWLRGWESELAHANWRAPKDLLRQFPRAKELGADIFDFPLSHRPQLIRVAITFPQAVALVISLECSK